MYQRVQKPGAFLAPATAAGTKIGCTYGRLARLRELMATAIAQKADSTDEQQKDEFQWEKAASTEVQKTDVAVSLQVQRRWYQQCLQHHQLHHQQGKIQRMTWPLFTNRH